MPMMCGYGYQWNWGAALFMALNMALWAALIGLIIWAVVRWASRRGPTDDVYPGPSAREILRQRYARGELDDATYARMLAQIEGSAPAPAPPVVAR